MNSACRTCLVRGAHDRQRLLFGRQTSSGGAGDSDPPGLERARSAHGCAPPPEPPPPASRRSRALALAPTRRSSNPESSDSAQLERRQAAASRGGRAPRPRASQCVVDFARRRPRKRPTCRARATRDRPIQLDATVARVRPRRLSPRRGVRAPQAPRRAAREHLREPRAEVAEAHLLEDAGVRLQPSVRRLGVAVRKFGGPERDRAPGTMNGSPRALAIASARRAGARTSSWRPRRNATSASSKRRIRIDWSSASCRAPSASYLRQRLRPVEPARAHLQIGEMEHDPEPIVLEAARDAQPELLLQQGASPIELVRPHQRAGVLSGRRVIADEPESALDRYARSNRSNRITPRPKNCACESAPSATACSGGSRARPRARARARRAPATAAGHRCSTTAPEDGARATRRARGPPPTRARPARTASIAYRSRSDRRPRGGAEPPRAPGPARAPPRAAASSSRARVAGGARPKRRRPAGSAAGALPRRTPGKAHRVLEQRSRRVRRAARLRTRAASSSADATPASGASAAQSEVARPLLASSTALASRRWTSRRSRRRRGVVVGARKEWVAEANAVALELDDPTPLGLLEIRPGEGPARPTRKSGTVGEDSAAAASSASRDLAEAEPSADAVARKCSREPAAAGPGRPRRERAGELERVERIARGDLETRTRTGRGTAARRRQPQQPLHPARLIGPTGRRRAGTSRARRAWPRRRARAAARTSPDSSRGGAARTPARGTTVRRPTGCRRSRQAAVAPPRAASAGEDRPRDSVRVTGAALPRQQHRRAQRVLRAAPADRRAAPPRANQQARSTRDHAPPPRPGALPARESRATAPRRPPPARACSSRSQAPPRAPAPQRRDGPPPETKRAAQARARDRSTPRATSHLHRVDDTHTPRPRQGRVVAVMMERTGIEPVTFGLQSRRSPS